MLGLLALIYGKIADVRNYLYDRGVLDTFDLGARTISIGNITAGGTGKTPLVVYVARVLAKRGEKVCILTRGYGRKEKKRVLVSDGDRVLTDFREAGDEPVELARKLVGEAIVIADPDRVAAAEWAKRKFGVTAFVLDDGFQHRRARRDVDIVCIDATEPFGGGKILPAGRLRESSANLARADAVVITRSDLIDDIADLEFEISEIAPDAKIFRGRNEICEFVGLEDFHAQAGRRRKPAKKEFKQKKILAFCALGNPESFLEMLRREELDIVGSRTFRDHHTYTQKDVRSIEASAGRVNADALMTTAKDAVKLSELQFGNDCYVVEIDLNLDYRSGLESMF